MKINAKKLEIKDKALIAKYMKLFSNFYIPANEHDTYDKEILDENIFHNSSKIIGQHKPIEVAICENDPNPESNPYHIHLRIIDGRHRWKGSIKNNVIWDTKFYTVKNYQEYMQLRGHFDSKKTITAREREEYFEKLAKYYEEELKIPMEKICAKITEDYSPPFTPATIRRYVPNQYKNTQARIACYSSVKKRHPMPIKEIQKKNPSTIRADYSRYNKTIETLETENEFLRAEIGHRTTFGTFYVLEELNGNHWDFIHINVDKDNALNELELLDEEKYRIRVVSHNYEYIFKETTNQLLLQKRKESESKRKQYESKKLAINKKDGIVIHG